MKIKSENKENSIGKLNRINGKLNRINGKLNSRLHPAIICNFPKFRQNSVKFSKKNSENSAKFCKIAEIRGNFDEK